MLPTVLKARLPVCTVFLHARWPGPMHAKKRGAHLRESGRSGMVGDPSGLEAAASNSLVHVAESPRLADWDVCLAPNLPQSPNRIVDGCPALQVPYPC